MIYFPENFGEQIEQFEKLIVLDKRYVEPKIKGKGSFSKFVRVKMLVYINQKNEELMQEKEKMEKEFVICNNPQSHIYKYYELTKKGKEILRELK